jgi:hypothetical protein
MPSWATFYRLMNRMDRGHRNFVNEASQAAAGTVRHPARPGDELRRLLAGDAFVRLRGS